MKRFIVPVIQMLIGVALYEAGAQPFDVYWIFLSAINTPKWEV